MYLLHCYIKRCAYQSDSKFVDEHIHDLLFQTFFLLSMKETYCLNCCHCCLLTSLGLFVLTVRGSEVCCRKQCISIYTEGLLVSIIIRMSKNKCICLNFQCPSYRWKLELMRSQRGPSITLILQLKSPFLR